MILSASVRSWIRSRPHHSSSHRSLKLTKRGKSNNQGPKQYKLPETRKRVLHIVRRQSVNVCHYFYVMTEMTKSFGRKSCLYASCVGENSNVVSNVSFDLEAVQFLRANCNFM